MQKPAALVVVQKAPFEQREEWKMQLSRLTQGPAGGQGGRTKVGAPRVGSGTTFHIGTTTIANEVSLSSCSRPGASSQALRCVL